MTERRATVDPLAFGSVACCHPSFSEAVGVEALYAGKRLEDLPVERVGESTDTPLLKPEAMAYYWPKILEAMLLKPTSPSSIEMIQLIFKRWRDEERLTEKFWEMHRLTPHLSTEDIWMTRDVLMEISPHLPPMDEGRNPLFAPSEIVRGALQWIDKKWPQTQGITHEGKLCL